MRGAAPPNVNLGPHHVSETNRDKKLKCHKRLGRVKYFFGCDTFCAKERVRGAAPPNVNLGPPHISETIRARNLKIYIQLGWVK